MTDNEDISQEPPSTRFGAINDLVNNPLAADSNELQQPEPNPNEITTNIIKDASKIANDNNNRQENVDFDNEDIQRKMNGVINDFQSQSITPDDNNLIRRKSTISGRLTGDQENSSTPALIDPPSDNKTQAPIRSMSESVLIDHHDATEQSSALPIQQDESSTDDDDNLDGIQATSTNVIGTNNSSINQFRQNSSSQKQQNNRNETPSRIQSASSKSHTKSSLNRPQSPLVGEQAQTSSRITSPQITKDDKNILIVNQSSSFNNHKEEQKQTFESPTAIISPASRRESTNKTDQQQISRPSSTMKSKFNDNSIESTINQSNNDFLKTNEQSKLIKPGEQLQIPINDIDNERFHSPPPSPSGTKQMVLINPLLENNPVKPTQDHSRPSSKKTNHKSPTSSSISNEKIIDGDIVSSKSRRSSNTSQQQTTIIDQKPNLTSSRKGSNVSEHQTSSKRGSRQNSSDRQKPKSSNSTKQERILSNDKQQQSPLQKHSEQQSKKNSNSTIDQTIITPIKLDSSKFRQQNEKRLSTTDSDNEHLNTSKLPRVNSSSQQDKSPYSNIKQSSSSQATTPTEDNQKSLWIKQVPIPPIQLTDDEIPSSRPQSPNVEQIAEHNPLLTTNKKRNTNEQKKKDQHRSLRRSNSIESFNRIPLVDDKSLDSTSGNNTESEKHKQRHIKSKTKNVETNTDSKNYSRTASINGNYQQQQQQQQESTPQKPMSDHSKRRRAPTKEQTLTTPDTEPDSNTQIVRRSVKQSKHSNKDKDPLNVNLTVIVKNMNNEDENEISQKIPKQKQQLTDYDRHTQSDTEQIITEKQKKRRRPKRISRTTQTYECVFRRMELEQHKELLPTIDTEKNIQTRKSYLHPSLKSSKKHYPLYLSTDAFKIEEVLTKQFPQGQRNRSKTSVVTQNTSSQNGKLLILRPTLPFHHTDAVNVQRINLQYAIDLIPNENKSNDLTPTQRNKSNALKQSEQTNNLPTMHSSLSTANLPTNKSNTKDKSISNRIEDRTNRRKTGGDV